MEGVFGIGAGSKGVVGTGSKGEVPLPGSRAIRRGRRVLLVVVDTVVLLLGETATCRLTSASPDAICVRDGECRTSKPGDASSNARRCAEVERIRPARVKHLAEKLGMDWAQLVRLRAFMTEDEQHRREVIGRLYALLTAKFEDGAEIAMRGQDPASVNKAELASSILEVGQEIVTVADGLLLLLQSRED